MQKKNGKKMTVTFVPLEPDEAKKREDAILKILAYGAHLCALEKQHAERNSLISFAEVENEVILETTHSFS